MKKEEEIQEVDKIGNDEDSPKLDDTVDSTDESKVIVPFKSEDLSPSNGVDLNQSNGLRNIWMFGAAAAIVTILGATLYATSKDAVLQQSQTEAPTSNRFLDWGFFWNSAETLPSNHDARQLMEYLFFILLGYCGSEMFSHLIHNEFNLLN